MNPINNSNNTNCIQTSSFCVRWDGGNIEYLGLCNGDDITNLIWEIVLKLQEISGESLANFDLTELLNICKQKAPLEKNLISILEIISSNQICLKDYIDRLNETLEELSKEQKVNVNLKCLADFDNFGNQLNVTRDQLDQLVIDKLCNTEIRINAAEGKIISIQNQINDIIVNPIVSEPEFSTCVDVGSKSTSQQVISVANKVCTIETYLGSVTDASNTRSNYEFEDSRYNLISGWLLNGQRGNILDDLNNAFLVIKDLEARIIDIQSTCCAPTCDKIQIGFSVVVEDAETGDYMIRFRPSDGTNLFGFTSIGSTIRFYGIDILTGNPLEFGTVIDIPVDINDSDWDANVYDLSNFDLSKPITISITANMVKDGLTCQKCISKTISLNLGCAVCQLTASGNKGDAGTITITYEY